MNLLAISRAKFATASVAVVVALSLVLSMVPLSARAQTTAELQAQINNLLQTISQLQVQLANLGGGVATNFTFTRNLTVGSVGEDVRQLQMRLNAEPGVQVAFTGAGSPGQETAYFGPLTRSAVIQYQNKYAASILLPLGLTQGTGYFGPSTRAHLNATQGGSTGDNGQQPGTGAGTEGSLTVTQEPVPSNGTDVAKGDTRTVSALEIEAQESDLVVNRMDVNFNVRPWLYLESIALLDGNTVIAEKIGLSASDFTEITEGSNYRIRFSNLSVTVPEDGRKILTVRVTARANVDQAARTITITHAANSVRATDTAGFTHEEPNSSFTRTFDFKSADTGNVEVSLNADAPLERNVIISSTGTTNNVELMRFDVMAKHSLIDINSLRFTLSTNGPSVSDVFDEIYLADNSGNKIASASTIASTTIFSTSDLQGLSKMMTSQGNTTTYRLVAVVNDADEFAAGTSASSTLTANTTNIVAEDANFDTATVNNVTLTGNTVYFFTEGANFSNFSASSTGVENTPYLAGVEFRFTVTAQGGPVFLSKTPSTMVSTSTTANSASLTSISASGSTSGDTATAYRIGSGVSRTFTLSGNMNNQGGTTGSKVFEITGINWGTSAGSPAANTTDFNLEELEVTRVMTAS